MTASAIIVAGGTGTRMGGPVPKQLLDLGGRPVIAWTLETFLACSLVAEVIVVSEPGSLDRIRALADGLADPDRIAAIVPGGATRQESVHNGLASAAPDSDIMVVHDAVRPFVAARDITACIEAAARHGAASLMRPVRETVKTVRDGVVRTTIDRDTVWITQTPQAFSRELLEEAHRRARADGFSGTDDGMLVERLGHPVHVVEGPDTNIKITTPADLILAEAIQAAIRGETSC